jgi:hypothetical protein
LKANSIAMLLQTALTVTRSMPTLSWARAIAICRQ